MTTTSTSRNCAPAVELLDHLCNGDRAVREYVLDWLAVTLQWPFAQRATAIAMRGPAGSGKSLFWSACALPIFGARAAFLSRDALNDQFNGWLMERDLVVFDDWREGLTAHGAAQLKHVLCDGVINVNRKFRLPVAVKNRMRFVFLSNAELPLEWAADLRHTVLIEPARRVSHELVERVMDWSATGGLGAFKSHMLVRDVRSFRAGDLPVVQRHVPTLKRTAADEGASA